MSEAEKPDAPPMDRDDLDKLQRELLSLRTRTSNPMLVDVFRRSHAALAALPEKE